MVTGTKVLGNRPSKAALAGTIDTESKENKLSQTMIHGSLFLERDLNLPLSLCLDVVSERVVHFLRCVGYAFLVEASTSR